VAGAGGHPLTYHPDAHHSANSSCAGSKGSATSAHHLGRSDWASMVASLDALRATEAAGIVACLDAAPARSHPPRSIRASSYPGLALPTARLLCVFSRTSAASRHLMSFGRRASAHFSIWVASRYVIAFGATSSASWNTPVSQSVRVRSHGASGRPGSAVRSCRWQPRMSGPARAPTSGYLFRPGTEGVARPGPWRTVIVRDKLRPAERRRPCWAALIDGLGPRGMADYAPSAVEQSGLAVKGGARRAPLAHELGRATTVGCCHHRGRGR